MTSWGVYDFIFFINRKQLFRRGSWRSFRSEWIDFFVSNCLFIFTLVLLKNLTMASVELTAPNGRTYIQPTGLFINNKWVQSSDGGKIASINPT